MDEKILEDYSIKKSLIKSLILFIGSVIGLYLLSFFNIGIEIDNFEIAILIILIIGIINSLTWPILTKLFLPFLVLTFGAGALILNGLLLYFLSFHIEGFAIEGYGTVIAPIVIAAITTILSGVLTIDEDSNYYRAVLRDATKKQKDPLKKYHGVIIIEIDGLAEDVLKEAIEKGYMPTVEKMIKSKTHILKEWETDLSSQTGASQAGILHGNNENITAFRWVEKENNNKMVRCSGAKDSKEIEKRISDGKGLLYKNGASRSNLFSGDSDNVIFTFSKILDLGKIYNKAWYSVFVNPNNFTRIVVLFIYEMILEIYSQIEHVIKNIKPRINRGLIYIPTRAVANVFLREVNTATLIGDMMMGDIDIAYSTYLGYDEIAHHSGVRDKDSFNALKSMDKQIERIYKASKISPRPYQIVVQSDHGQTNGATFKQRYGTSFEKFIKSLLPEYMSIYANMSSNEDHFYEEFIPLKNQIEFIKNKYNTSLDYIKKYESNQIEFIKNKYNTSLDYIKKYGQDKVSYKKPGNSEVIVLASGNLAMIYLTQWSERLTYEQIVALFPELIPGIVNNPYIGFILVKSKTKGDLAIGSEGIYYLDTGKIEGKNPLEKFGKNIVQHLKRSSSFKYTPDILVNSFYDSDANEVCAFEELVGSHGGVGGGQSKPFILYPSSWNVPNEIIGAEKIYEILKENAESLKLNN